MSTDNLHGDSLLSSISNISVRIDHTDFDDPGFFRNVMHHSHDEHLNYGEVPLEAFDDNEDIDHGSLLEKIYFKYKPHQNGHEQH